MAGSWITFATVIGMLGLLGSGLGAQTDTAPAEHDPRYGILSPIPDRGGVPPIVDMLTTPSEGQLALRARSRQFTRQIRAIRHKYLGKIKVPSLRAQGLAQLWEFTDPAAFMPLIRELTGETDDVRLGLLDHFATLGDDAQAALGWVAIYDHDPAIRHEALTRMVSPAGLPVLNVLDQALRQHRHEIANNAGFVAGALNALETIPLLIFAQATADPVDSQGDLAWIAIATQTAYVQRIEAVTGDAAGAFRPILGIITEGVILRVVDAVAINYRTEIHRSLVAMTTNDWGQSTEHLGYDMARWRAWYNEDYLPLKREQARLARLAAQTEAADGQASPSPPDSP